MDQGQRGSAATNARPLYVDSAAIERRNEVVTELTKFYEFLTTLYLPEDCLKYPPSAEGWPSITAERLSRLGKTDAVIDVLKHIPYIQPPYREDGYQIYPSGEAWDYDSLDIRKHQFDPLEPELDILGPAWEGLEAPQHIATIAHGFGIRDWWIVLDTRDGRMARVRLFDECADMRCVEFASVRELIEELRQGFDKLKVLPISTKEVIDADATGLREDEVRRIQDLYRSYGWPAEYRKANCMREIEALDEKRRLRSIGIA